MRRARMIARNGARPGRTYRKAGLALLWAALAVGSFLGVGRSLWTPDEPREAEIGREMYLSPGVVTTLNGEAYYEKPPLYYWLVAAAYWLRGGPSPAAARAVSGLACFLTLIVLFLWAKRAHSTSAAVIAVLILATSGVFFISTHWVRLDPLLALLTTVAFWSAWEVANGGGSSFLVALHSALVLGLWTKGFIGPVLVGAGLTVWCVLEREDRPWRALKPLLGVGLLLSASLAFGAALYLEGGGEAVWQWAWVNHVQRFLHPHAKGHEHPFYYYAAIGVPLAVFPWLTPILDLFKPAFWKADTRTRPLKRFIGSLLAAGLFVLTLSSSKRETYLLPLMAPLCLLSSFAVIDRFALVGDAPSSRRRPGAAAWANAIVLGIVGAAPATALVIYTRAIGPATVLWLLLALLAGAATFLFLKRNDLRRAAACAMVSGCICCVSILVLVMPALDEEKSFVPFLSWIDAQLEAGEPVYAVGADETLRGIVPFVTGRSVVVVKPSSLQELNGSETLRPGFLVCQQVDTEPVQQEVEEAYDLLRSTSVGSRRSLSLWRLKWHARG